MAQIYLKHKAYINLPMILRVVGLLLVIEAAFMVIPCLTALYVEEESVWPFLICLGITGGCGALMTLLRPKSRDMGKREAILLTGFTWVVLSLFGMLPFMFYGTHLSITDAFFETMSGFTTTGASVLNTLVDVPKSILLWRCIIQWIGGLGIILFTLAVVPMLNYSGGMQLFNAEVTGITHDKLRPQVSYTAKGLWGVYAIFTGIFFTTCACALKSFDRLEISTESSISAPSADNASISTSGSATTSGSAAVGSSATGSSVSSANCTSAAGSSTSSACTTLPVDTTSAETNRIDKILLILFFIILLSPL